MRILPTVVARLIKNAKFVTMKRFLLALLALSLFLGCNDIQPTGKYGIFVNDLLETELKSAFVGGAVADPSIGSSHRLHIYEKNYSSGPRWNEVKEVVHITGFRYTGTDYPNLGACISSITVNGPSSIGTLAIPLNQGKYEGGNELVSSVKIANYSFGSQDEKAQIDIRITLKDNQTIGILYSGPAHYDNYF